VIIDARCCLDAALWADAGWTVHVLGRPSDAYFILMCSSASNTRPNYT